MKMDPIEPSDDDAATAMTERAARVAEWITAYLTGGERHAVHPRTVPGETARLLPQGPPEGPEPFDRVMADLDEIIVPRLTHWNHPGFLAYFAISAAESGVWAEAISAALNVNAMLWRTAPAATELEEVTLGWLRQMLGLPEGFGGVIQDTASTSTLVALAAARHRALPGCRASGLAGSSLRLYCSEEAHSSVDKAALVLGLGTSSVRRIATDDRFRLRIDLLRDAIDEDRRAGHLPFAVVATSGTTVTTAVDPVAEIARICREERLWLHVDAAYGGSAAILPEMRWVLDGAGDADSVVVNPHKWLFVPIDCSALFMRDRNEVREAFSVVPDYLATADAATNLMDYGPALGRRFRALKLWMTIRQFGVRGMRVEIRRHLSLARTFAAWVRDDPEWEVLAPVDFSVVVFRHRGGRGGWVDVDAFNETILARVNASGEVFLSSGRVGGRVALRVAIGNLGTGKRHLERAWSLLRAAATTVGGDA